jgi:hypothetical protein
MTSQKVYIQAAQILLGHDAASERSEAAIWILSHLKSQIQHMEVSPWLLENFGDESAQDEYERTRASKRGLLLFCEMMETQPRSDQVSEMMSWLVIQGVLSNRAAVSAQT